MSTPDGWSRDERAVHQKLDTLDNDIREMKAALERRIDNLQAQVMAVQTQEIVQIKVELAMLKVKAGLWGGGFGLLPAAMIVLYQLVKGA